MQGEVVSGYSSTISTVSIRKAVLLLQSAIERLGKKANYYTPGSNDLHFNFEYGRSILGLEKKWMTAYAYAAKHLGVLGVAFKDGRSLPPDTAKEVLGDIVIYMALIYEMMLEDDDAGH